MPRKKKKPDVPVYLKVLRTEYLVIEASSVDKAVQEAKDLDLTVLMADYVPLDEEYIH